MAPVVPTGPYPDNISEAEMLVKAQDSQRSTASDELSTVTRELVQLTEMLKKIPIDEVFDYKEIKAVLDRLEALVATSPGDYCCGKHEREKLKDKDRNKAQTRFGRVYYGTGETIPPILTKEEWETLKNGVKDDHAADPAPGPNDGLSDNDIYEEMKAEEAMEKKATSEQEWYRKAANKPEWPGPQPCGYHPVKPLPMPDLSKDKDGKDKGKKIDPEMYIGIQPPKPWPEMAYDELSDPSIQPDKPWPRVEQPTSTSPNIEVEPCKYEGSYDIHLKRYGKIQAYQKKERWMKGLTVFCKVIIYGIGIFYGIIIIEQLLIGKPIATFLNRVVFGE